MLTNSRLSYQDSSFVVTLIAAYAASEQSSTEDNERFYSNLVNVLTNSDGQVIAMGYQCLYW